MIGPSWLIDDLLRVEQLLVATAGASRHPLVSEPSLHLVNAGGKRVRPALVLLASRAGESGRLESDLAAAAVELVHLATLYHDDVLDETETRRGVPTTHEKWGVEVAVLAGDYLFACGSALGADAGGEVPGILARAIAAVCEGQIMETATLGDVERSIDDYMQTIERKTAALFAASCDLGSSTAEADGDARHGLVAYGEHLGIAFQMVDDLVDIVGDPVVTGKQPGTDLREAVFTLPVLLAARKDPSLGERIAKGERELDALFAQLEATGALEEAHALAHDHGRQAREELKRAPRGDYRDALHDIVDGVLAQVEL